ncbi:MAG TPA: EAL domain-containing protein [Syntrophorhabdaceae bacterium]|nr:EAL domain-containing protein [Syntrophorhabdaceae bacterium]
MLSCTGNSRNQSASINQDLSKALRLESVVAHFQPILSLNSHSIVGYEGLARGMAPGETGLIPPLALFQAARKENKLIDLDRLCRDVILEEYGTIKREKEGALLFLNFESSLLNTIEPGNGYLYHQVKERGINSSDIVIEIIESRVRNIADLIKFVSFYRQKGFLIALDDVGTGYSNFDRITAIKPDLLKIDRSILRSIEKDYYKQEVFRSLGNLAKKIGALVLAEGVETQEETLCVMDLNADLAQGYYFAKPQAYDVRINENAHETISEVRDHFRLYKIRKIGAARRRHQLYDTVIKHIVARLTKQMPHGFDELLKDIINRFSYVEALYILNSNGTQCTDTVLNRRIKSRNKIFQSAQKGDDLSLKEYFYLLVESGMPKYTTESYISFATGNLCRTITAIFRSPDNERYVLCVDVSEDNNDCGAVDGLTK